MYPDKFLDQIAVVTGAAQDIGEVTARLLAAQGAIVILVDLNEKKLKEVTAKMNSEGAKIYALMCHVYLSSGKRFDCPKN
jgi:NADP-dependent 3-hydroxy acid dehydrogenase YdfG